MGRAAVVEGAVSDGPSSLSGPIPWPGGGPFRDCASEGRATPSGYRGTPRLLERTSPSVGSDPVLLLPAVQPARRRAGATPAVDAGSRVEPP